MIKRITADIDTKNILALCWNIYKVFIYVKEFDRLELKKSNSKGYHLIVWSRKNYTQAQIFHLRYLIGDDKKRIDVDKKRKHPKQYLFYKKRKLK